MNQFVMIRLSKYRLYRTKSETLYIFSAFYTYFDLGTVELDT